MARSEATPGSNPGTSTNKNLPVEDFFEVNEQTALLVTGFERVFFILSFTKDRKPPATVVENPGTSTNKNLPVEDFFEVNSVPSHTMSGIRKSFPCECTHERKRCTETVSFEMCTHGPGTSTKFLN